MADRRRRVNDRLDMGVVEIETVDEDTVGERTVPHREPQFAADHRAIAAFGKPRDAGERDRTEIIGVGGEPEPDAVEYQEFCAFTHGSRVCENVPA